MRSSARSILSLLRILALVAGLVLLAPINPGRATDGRDFAGFYAVSNVADLGTDYRVTLTVRVFNYSDADVSGATVTLQDSFLIDTDYGTFPGTISIPDRDSVRISANFTVSRAEYDSWQSGGTPRLRVDYQNNSGNAVRRTIELAEGLAGEE